MNDVTTGSAPAGNPAPATGAGLAASAALTSTPAAETPAAAPAPAPSDAWYTSLPAATQATITAKGWNSLSQGEAFTAVLDSYVNLEKLFGSDKAGRTVTLPKDDASPEERMEFFRKIGVPEKADGYGFDKMPGVADLPAEVQSTLSDAQAWMHKAGVPKMVAENLLKEVAAAEAAKAEAWANESQKELNALTVELGAEFENRIEVARRAARAAGLGPDDMVKVERALGTKQMLKMFMAFGETMREATPPVPGQSGTGFNDTAEGARTQLQNLYADKDFMAQYLSPNPKVRQPAIEKMERLNRIIAGG